MKQHPQGETLNVPFHGSSSNQTNLHRALCFSSLQCDGPGVYKTASKRVVTCLCCSPRPGPLPSMAPRKSINPPIGDCNHISSDSLVPLGWRCGCHQQAALRCQTTDSTPTWLTAAGSAFPFCHEKEKTLECPPSARCHGPRPVVLKQGTALPTPPQPTSADIYDCHHSRDRGGQGCGSAPHRAQGSPHHTENGLALNAQSAEAEKLCLA